MNRSEIISILEGHQRFINFDFSKSVLIQCLDYRSWRVNVSFPDFHFGNLELSAAAGKISERATSLSCVAILGDAYAKGLVDEAFGRTYSESERVDSVTIQNMACIFGITGSGADFSFLTEPDNLLNVGMNGTVPVVVAKIGDGTRRFIVDQDEFFQN